jgi:uncharacterized protein (TIGR02118 family)
MFTVIFTVYAKEGLSHEEFVRRWLSHAPVAAKLPKVRGYRICPVTSSGDVLDPPADGFAIFEFDSEADFEAALASPEMAESSADSDDFARHFGMYRADTHRIV